MAPTDSFGRTISESIKTAVSDISNQIRGLGQEIGGKFKEVFSDEMNEVLDLGKSALNRLTGFFAPIIKPFQNLLKSWFKDSTLSDIMKSVKGLFKLESIRRKEELAQRGLKGKGFWAMFLDTIAIPIAAILALGAGLIRRLLLPFELLLKSFTLVTKIPVIGPIIKKISNLISFLSTGLMKLVRKIPIIGTFLTNTGELIDKFIKKFSIFRRKMTIITKKILRFLDKIPGLRMLLKGIKFGFKVLGWPLQILFSTIDFIRGYMNEQGNILDKLKAGIKNVIIKFIEFPVDLLGKAFDWMLGLFGVENFGSAEKVKSTVAKGIDSMFKVFGGIVGFSQDMVSKAQSLWENVGGFMGIIDTVSNFFSDMWLGLQNWIYNFLKDHPTMGKLAFGGKENYQSILNQFGEDIKEAAQAKKEAEEREKQKLELMRRQAEAAEETAKKTGRAGGVQVIQSQSNRATGAPTPDSMPSSRGVSNSPYSMRGL